MSIKESGCVIPPESITYFIVTSYSNQSIPSELKIGLQYYLDPIVLAYKQSIVDQINEYITKEKLPVLEVIDQKVDRRKCYRLINEPMVIVWDDPSIIKVYSHGSVMHIDTTTDKAEKYFEYLKQNQ